jgi:hypothetical protein
MKTLQTSNRHWEPALWLLLLAGSWAIAQNPQPATGAAAAAPAANPAPPPAAPAQRSAADLEKLVMPIALHPDPLIAIILPASVYPIEIVQAARFVKDTNNIAKVDQQPWDENVKAVAKFPDLIAKMDKDLAWTTDLGQAFLDQPKDVMDTIQALRSKAQKAGTLRTSDQQIVVVTNEVVQTTVEQQVVVVTNTVVQIVPSNPEVVYVPSYPPTVYYPPPAYVYDPYAPLVTFGVGMAMGAIIANNCDWHGGGVYVGHHGVAVWGGGDYNGGHNTKIKVEGDVNIGSGNRNNINSGNRPTARPTQGQKWQPDQNRLRSSGAPGAANSARTAEARGWSSGAAGAARPSTQPAGGGRPTAGTGAAGAARPSTGAAASRPSTGTAATRPSTGGAATRPSTGGSSVSRPAAQPRSQGSAFGGVGSGSSARASSNRGVSSRSGGFGGGGGGRTGGGRR